jgi:beta-lactamase regulating signal transducer with metallopeptidase domain
MSASSITWLNALASRWADYMGDSLLSGTLALILAWVMCRLFQRRVASCVVCVLWAVVLVRVAVPFTVSVALPEAVAAVVPPSTGAMLPEMHDDPAGPAFTALARTAAAPVLSIQSILLLLWFAGVAGGSVWLLRAILRTRRIMREARPALPGEIPVDIDAIASGAGWRRPVVVKISPVITSPAAAGLWSPVLLLPEGLSGKLTAGQWRWTLAHELLHLRRGDLWMQVYQTLMKVVFFFHPAVWIAGRELDARREQLCDAGARALTNVPPHECAEGFLTLLELAGRSHPAPFVAVGISGGHRRARQRLQQLLSGAGIQSRRFTPWAALIIAALVLLPGFRAVREKYRSASDGESRVAGARPLPERGSASSQERIQQLESRVAELEKQLQGKSRLESYRESARAAARVRAARDAEKYTADELHEMENIYQAARKETSFDLVEAAMQPLFDRFPGSNRAGCAALYVGRNLTGEERERWLQYAIAHGSDCQFLDGTSVGGLARVLLAADRIAAGQTDAASPLLKEVCTSYADGIDFDGTPLVDLTAKLGAPQ